MGAPSIPENSPASGGSTHAATGRALVLAEGQLGDLLLLGPALRALGGAQTTLLILRRRAGRDAPLVEESRQGTPFVHSSAVGRVIVVNRDRLRSLGGWKRLGAELEILRLIRRGKFHTVLCTFPEDRFALWAYASGAGVRTGQKRQPFRLLLTHTPDIAREERGVMEYYADLVRAMGLRVDAPFPEFQTGPPEEAWAEEFLRTRCPAVRPLVAVHPGGSGRYKIWPPDRFAALVRGLRREGAGVLLLAGSGDEETAREILSNLDFTPALAQTGSDPGKLGAILRRCDLCISNDSGPRHVAVALGVPSLALFRLHHRRAWGIYPEGERIRILEGKKVCPLCSGGGCGDRIPRGERYGSACLRMITPEDVLGSAREMLRALRGTRPAPPPDAGSGWDRPAPGSPLPDAGRDPG
ncbi:MAG: glycosyltransferase family 9 protein [Bacteroidota bacterium]